MQKKKPKDKRHKTKMVPIEPPTAPPRKPTVKWLATQLTIAQANIATLRLDVDRLQQLGPGPAMPGTQGDKGERGEKGEKGAKGDKATFWGG